MVEPGARFAEVGAKVIEVNVALVTLSNAVPDTPPKAAVMVTFGFGFTPRILPWNVTFASVGFEEVHFESRVMS